MQANKNQQEKYMSFLLKTCKHCILIVGLLTLINTNVFALEIIYDAQLDAFLKDISKDLLKAANVKNVKLYIANSDQINAFATPDNEIVVYSGLIEKMQNENQLQGVLAHELGHLVSKHHLKKQLNQTSIPAAASVVVGVGAAIAGAPQVGMSSILGGSAANVSNTLSYSRQYENEADVTAIQLLQNAKLSTRGLGEFFKILQNEERLQLDQSIEFLSTHPSTKKEKIW